MGYGGTDYQPVFADVPAGWKERWRLLREYVERWYQIPMEDVGGPLKPFPPSRRRSWDESAIQSVDQAMSDRKVSAGLPPSVREWLLFIREVQLGLRGFGGGSGDVHNFWDSAERITFFHLDGGREGCFVRAEDRHEPDPPAWHCTLNDHRGEFVAPHVTTLALHYILTQYEPEFGMKPGAQKMTKPFARRLASAFPVHSRFDETRIYERANVIALWIPRSLFTGDVPHVHVKVRPPANPDEVDHELWDLNG
jgi:hypothetical protein